MSTPTERLAADLPLAAIPLHSEIAHQSGGKIVPEFAEKVGELRNANVPREPSSAVNEEQNELLTDVMEVFKSVQQAGGVQPATLLNMHPWKLKATGPHNEGIVVDACPINQEFVVYTQTSYRVDFGDRWGKFKVRPIWPIELMRDFQRQNGFPQGSELPAGGLVVYRGDFIPGQVASKTSLGEGLMSIIQKVSDLALRAMLIEAAEKDIREQSSGPAASEREVMKEIKKQREIQINFYEKMFDWADQRWAEKTKSGYGSVQNPHRQIARWLLARGRISKLPEWVTDKKPRDFVQTFCPKCGGELSEKGYACPKCGRVDKPIVALKDGAITIDDPSLKRCSRQDLDAAGLEHITTLDEDIAAAKATGKKEKKKEDKA